MKDNWFGFPWKYNFSFQVFVQNKKVIVLFLPHIYSNGQTEIMAGKQRTRYLSETEHRRFLIRFSTFWKWFGLISVPWKYCIPNLKALPWKWRFKELWSLMTSSLGLWRTLEVPDWGFTFWKLFGVDQCALTILYAKFEGSTKVESYRI